MLTGKYTIIDYKKLPNSLIVKLLLSNENDKNKNMCENCAFYRKEKSCLDIVLVDHLIRGLHEDYGLNDEMRKKRLLKEYTCIQNVYYFRELYIKYVLNGKKSTKGG